MIVAFAEDDSFNRRMVADNGEAREAVAGALEALVGGRVRIEYELRDISPAPEARELGGDELVDRLRETFDAEEILPEPTEPLAVEEVAGEDDGDPGPEAP